MAGEFDTRLKSLPPLTRGQAADQARYQGQADKYKQQQLLSPDGKTWLGGQVLLAPDPAPNRLPTTTKPPGTSNGNGASNAAANAAAAAQAKANAAARAAAQKQNEATASLVDGQYKLLGAFGQQRDTKIANINSSLADSDRNLLSGYQSAFGGLEKLVDNNDKAVNDSSFQNIANAVRERQDISGEAASLGAGESDILRAQLQALRNYSANQGDVNRSYFDTLANINNAIGSLNTDTATSRQNLYSQAESDKESAFSNYYNQTADTWTQIGNIENANTNVNSDSSVAYTKRFGNAGDQAAAATSSHYQRQMPQGLEKWDGKGDKSERVLNSSKPAVVSLGAPMKRPEGATLRRA